MRTYKMILSVIGLAFIVWFQSCKDNNDPSAEGLQLQDLSGTWMIGNDGSVTLDAYDVTSYFINFNLSIASDKTYTTSGGKSPNPWPASGTWSFAENADGSIDLIKIIRNDGLVVIIEEITATTLQLSFVHDEAIHSIGKTGAVSGEYVFILEKQ